MKRIRKLKPHVASYIAGLVDGEGTVTLARAHRNEHRQLSVAISNTDINILNWVLKMVGLGKIVPHKVYNKNHRQGFTYRVVSREAMMLLKQITPYLLTYKKKRAKMVIKSLERLTLRNGKYTPKMLKEKRKFVEKFMGLNPTNQKKALSFI